MMEFALNWWAIACLVIVYLTAGAVTVGLLMRSSKFPASGQLDALDWAFVGLLMICWPPIATLAFVIWTPFLISLPFRWLILAIIRGR